MPLSASVAIPGLPRFYKSNLQGSNKSVSIIPNFYPPGWENTKQGLYLRENENSGQSEVEYTLLGVKREESKSILLENIFIYGVDPNIWNISSTLIPTRDFTRNGYCSIINSSRQGIVSVRSNTNPNGYLIQNRRLQNVQLLGGTVDVVYDPSTLRPSTLNTIAPISDLTTLTESYVAPVIYHDSKRSCVVMEGWLEPYITPWWRDFPGDYCGDFINTSPFSVTLTLESARAYRYEPGKATTFTMGIKANLEGGVGVFDGEISNSRAMWGARNDTDSYRFVLEGDGSLYVERVTPYAETTTRVNRSNFIDPLDGTGESGISINFAKITMYSIEFSWYGAIGANFFAYIPTKNGDAKWIKLASIPSSNLFTKPALSSPNMRLFSELYIPMGCSKLQSLSLYGSSIYIDGGYRDTLKYYTVSTNGKPVEQRLKTYATLEVPNFLEQKVSKPRNNANVYPYRLNGISTVNSQIDLYESINGGSPDIITAYRQTSEPTSTADSFFLASNVIVGSRNFVVSAVNMTDNQKIDFMRRAVNGFLTMTNPVTTYSIFSNAGPGRISGDNISFSLQIQSLSSRVNDNRINIILDQPLYGPFFRYFSTNSANIALRNTLSGSFPNIATYPSLQTNAVIFSPTAAPSGRAHFLIDTNVKNNRSFIVTKVPLKSGTFSFDTDIGTQSNGGGFFASYGIISQTEYNRIKNNKNFLDVLNTNQQTQVQIVSTSPANEFLLNSEYYFSWTRGNGGSGLNNPVAAGFPQALPFFRTGQGWVLNELPERRGPFTDFVTSTINPLIPGIQNKINVSTLLDDPVFTLNVDIRDHEFYFYGSNAELTTGPDSQLAYVRVRLASKDLFSLEDGLLTNNLYNFKMLIYGHNGQMFNCVANRSVTSSLNNWIEPNARLMPLIFGDGSSYGMSDGVLETEGSIFYTVAFPRTNIQAINAFIQKPNLRFNFKTVFLRNTQYRSPASVNFRDRNAGLWFGTFFINTIEPVHLFVLLQSNIRSNNNYPQQILQSTTPISRPMITNLQLFNAVDKNNVKLSETPLVDSVNVTLVRELTSTSQGALRDLPLVNFNFNVIPGVNTLVDNSTSQFLNTREKIRRFTFFVNKDLPFNYDLSSVYGNNKVVLTSQSTSILNKDFKRFLVTAKTIQDESFGSPWWFSVENNGGTRTPFSILNPLKTGFDAARFRIDTTNTRKNVYLFNSLKTPAISDSYFVWSIYAKSLTPSISAGRFIIFELKTGESNSFLRFQPVFFDIIGDRIGFINCGTSSIGGNNCNWQNNYDNMIKGRLTADNSLLSSANWFPATASRIEFPDIKGYANLANKNNGRYVVAAHIENVGDGWKRLSTCTYYNNNHTDNVIYIGNYTNTFNTSGNVSLWGFQEEQASTSSVETLSSWYPSAYVPIETGLISLNLTTGEQI